jgi:hypothetical protein
MSAHRGKADIPPQGCDPTPELRVERLFQLRRIRKEQLSQSPAKEEKRENNSVDSLVVHVFTQPR